MKVYVLTAGDEEMTEVLAVTTNVEAAQGIAASKCVEGTPTWEESHGEWHSHAVDWNREDRSRDWEYQGHGFNWFAIAPYELIASIKYAEPES